MGELDLEREELLSSEAEDEGESLGDVEERTQDDGQPGPASTGGTFTTHIRG